MPRREGQTFRDYLRAATEGWRRLLVLVTSWNEWPKNLPSLEFSSTWPDPYPLLKILREWARESPSCSPNCRIGLTGKPSKCCLQQLTLPSGNEAQV